MAARRWALVWWFTCLAALLTLENVSPQASARGDADAVRLSLTADGITTVLVGINGTGPFRLVLDTGSNRSTVSATVVRRLQLEAVARTTVVTAAANIGCEVVRLDTVTLGRVTKRDLPVNVIGEAGQAALGAGIDGILGQDFLLDETYTLDYDRGRLIWTADRSTSVGWTKLTLKKDEGRWLVALPQSPDGSEPLWFVPDSGASTLTLFDRGTPMTIGLRPLPSWQTVRTIGGSRDARLVLVDRLRIGSAVVRDRPAVVVNRRAPDAPAGDGLLPLALFRSVSFEPATASLIVRLR